MTTPEASVHFKTSTLGLFHDITGHEPKSQSNMHSMQLFMTIIQSFDGEPFTKYDPDERLFDNPNGSLESEGEIDIPQMTPADSDSDSSSDSDSDSSDDDDEPGHRARSSTRTSRQSKQTSRTQPKRGSEATKRGSLTPINLFDEESQDDSDSLTAVPPPPSRSERHVVIDNP